jgi:mRNA interferase MazF
VVTASGSGAPATYVPDRGDVVWLEFDPQAGREQAGRRPAVILSPASYNRPTGRALCVPVSSKAKGYPFEVAIPPGFAVTGVAFADQVKCEDWRARRATYIGALPPAVVAQVLALTRALLS